MFTVGKRHAAETRDGAEAGDDEPTSVAAGTSGTEQSESRSNVGHPEPSMPVPCGQSANDLESQAIGGSRKLIDGPGDQQSSKRSDAGGVGRAGVSTDDDTAARGWVIPPGGSRVDALFLVSTERLGIGRSESTDPPIWFDLTRVLKLDAIGEPDRGLLHVELVMDDDTVVAAGWPEAFCNKVVEALSATRSTPASEGPDSYLAAAAVLEGSELGIPDPGLVKSDQASADSSQLDGSQSGHTNAGDSIFRQSQSQSDQPEPIQPVADHPDSPFSAKPVVRRRSRNRRNGGENSAAGTASNSATTVANQDATPGAGSTQDAPADAAPTQGGPTPDGSIQGGPTPDGSIQGGSPNDGQAKMASGQRGGTSDASVARGVPAVGDESAEESGDTSDNETADPADGDPGSKAVADVAAPSPSVARTSTDPVDHARAAVGAARRNAALELEDVTYLGGLPGQTKRRKRCVATLTMDGFELKGPADLSVELNWDSVKSIETQNSDEARFRTNTKIHRDSSALVIACEDGLTLMLEARDCPTVPLRAAISQLLGELSVEVV
ncbi:MAG: hypothetical protein WBF71_05400 [Microthrixaceae bacterium]